MIITSFAVIATGSVILAVSSANAKEQVKTNLSGEVELSTNYENVNVLSEVESATTDEEQDNVEWTDPKIELFNNVGAYDPLYGLNEVVSIGKNYKNQVVMLEDAFIDKENAESNAVRIMDYIYNFVDKNILEQNGINLEEYERSEGEIRGYMFHIQRRLRPLHRLRLLHRFQETPAAEVAAVHLQAEDRLPAEAAEDTAERRSLPELTAQV